MPVLARESPNSKAPDLIVNVLIISAATPMQSVLRAQAADLIKRLGVEPNFKNEASIATFRGEPPGAKQFSDILSGTFGKSIWNDRVHRVRERNFEDKAFGSGRLAIVVESDFTHGPELACPVCGVALHLEASSTDQAFECIGIGCGKIYCAQHSPKNAKCSCGAGIRISNVRYPNGNRSLSSSLSGSRALTADDIIYEAPALVKIMIPAGYIGVELHDESAAQEVANELSIYVQRQQIELIGSNTGVSLPMAQKFINHLESTFLFIKNAKRIYVVSESA